MDSATSFLLLLVCFKFWCLIPYLTFSIMGPVMSSSSNIPTCFGVSWHFPVLKNNFSPNFHWTFLFLTSWVTHKFPLGWNILLLRMFTWSATAFCSIYFVWKEQDQWGRNNFTTILRFYGNGLDILGKGKIRFFVFILRFLSNLHLNLNLLVRLHPSLKAFYDFWS